MKKALRRALFCSPKPLRHGRASTVQCCRILLRKSLVRGWRASGLLKKSSLEQSSRILPPRSMKITRLRSLGRSVLGSCSAIPSTVISPFWKGSSALMVLISVDLPEPEGPHTTTTSPFWMVAVHSLSTCTGPYHLDTFLSSIISFSSIQSLLHQHRSADDRDLLVQALDRPGQRVAHDEVQNRSGQVCL